ncbi:hypothetical protein PR001_g5744 [Phytophthora rubi]|nr:hypothetical protein PR002_g6181 [Phytophthora rubi]KAE9043567.1 hypothetical protein PR001_g5744 [Phytophthora rubi]
MEALLVKDENKTTINSERVKEAIVELFSSTIKEIVNYLDENEEDYPTFTLVADFWTCKTTNDKFLGVRVYLVDKEWQFKSILLGTRKVDPAYGDRDGGIQKPFRAWLDTILEDFGLQKNNFYGATSDSGADVKSMLRTGLNLRWEWCMAHMAHAATKASCGVNGAVSAEANPEMADLITRMTKTIFQIKHVSTTGNLFKELGKSNTKGAYTRLVGYSTSRFLSLTNALERVILKWPAITMWYEERERQALRANKSPPDFPLANRYDDLVHVLSVLKQMGEIKRSYQAERPVQVEVLAQLFLARIHDMNSDQALPHYLSTDENPRWIAASVLTPLAAKTRSLLREALDERFFCRYYKDTAFAKCDFLLEMQMKLHPIYKRTELSLDRAVILCCRQHNKKGKESVERKNAVSAKIRHNLLELLKAVIEPADTTEQLSTPSVARVSRLEAAFALRPSRPPMTSSRDRRAEEELDRWLEDEVDVERCDDGTPNETVLEFWRRLQHEGEYRIIPKAVKVLFAIPASSCEIERDFGVSGNMVTSQRTSLADHNVDMCSFLNRNRDFVDLLQCEEIPKGQHHLHTPSSFIFAFDSDLDYDMDEMTSDILANFVSSTSLANDLAEEEEKTSL